MEEIKNSNNKLKDHPILPLIFILLAVFLAMGMGLSENSKNENSSQSNPVSGQENTIPTVAQHLTSEESSAVSNEPTMLTNVEYARQLLANVVPFTQSAAKDMGLGASVMYSDPSTALLDYKQAQIEFSKARVGLEALQGKVPAGLSDINGLFNEYISNGTKGLDIIMTALSSGDMSNFQDGLVYLNKAVLYKNQAEAAIAKLNAQN